MAQKNTNLEYKNKAHMGGWLSTTLLGWSWMVLASFIFILSEMGRISDWVNKNFIWWSDIWANYALMGLFAAVICVGAAGILSLGVWLFPSKTKLFWAGMWAGMFMIWGNILRLVVQAAFEVRINPSIWLLAGFLCGLLMFWKIGLIEKWILATDKFIEGLALTIVALWVFFIASAFLTYLVPEKAAFPKSGSTPNVILIILDSMPVDDMSLYGYPLETTPKLKRFAKDWTVYNNAHAVGTGTFAIMPTILTGRYPYFDQGAVYGERVSQDKNWVNLAALLKRAGYQTLMFEGIGYNPGFYHFGQEWDNYYFSGTQYPFRNQLDLLPGSFYRVAKLFWLEYSPVYRNNWIVKGNLFNQETDLTTTNFNEDVYRIINKTFVEKKAKPFFMYIHLYRPHFPYLGGDFKGNLLPREAGFTSMEEQNEYYQKKYEPSEQSLIDKLRLRFDENIQMADWQVGQLLENIQQIGLYKDSLIIVTADHGTSFNYGYQGYGSPNMFNAEHHIPLLVKYPEQERGNVVNAVVSSVDIFPTITSQLGLAVPNMFYDGVPLTEVSDLYDRLVFVRRFPVNDSRTYLAAVGKKGVLVKHGENTTAYDALGKIIKEETLTGYADLLINFISRMENMQNN
jgi:arylsulfatase A-like enzyme